MIDTETFIKNSPFQITHNDSASSYNLTNATPELLKFQLQEQYRNTLKEMNEKPSMDASGMETSMANTLYFEDSFNSHLQANLDLGNIALSDSIPSLSSTPTCESEDGEIDTFILGSSNKPTYLNLKVLIENSILDTSKINKDAILSLSTLKQLKDTIEYKKESREYIGQKLELSQLFITNFVLKQGNELLEAQEDNEELDSKLLMKILKQSTELLEQFTKINEELELLLTKLNNHNMACLVLGYVEDVRLSGSYSQANSSDLLSALNQHTQDSPFVSPKKTGTPKLYRQESLLKQFDLLFSHIAAVAVQHNVSLPPPSPSNSDSIEARTRWAQLCIDAVARNVDTTIPKSNESASTTASVLGSTYQDLSIFSTSLQKSNTAVNERTLAEYKTALNDLRFSHQFLTKEYELSRENLIKVIHEYRRKMAAMEKELTRMKSGNEHTGHGDSFSDDSESAKDKEIARLRKELSLLKVDRMGTKPSLSNTSSHVSSPLGGHMLAPYESMAALTSATSLVSNLHNVSLIEDDEGLESRPSSSSGVPLSNGGTSNGILRKEFKKIVNDIHDQYEVELSQEKMKRKKLQEEYMKMRRHAHEQNE